MARIHCESLEGDFLSSIGQKFLKIVYDETQAITAVYDGEVLGFLAYTTNDKKYFGNVIKKQFFNFTKILFIRMLQKPGLIPKIIQTVLYSDKADIGIHTELLTLAVKKKYRRKRIATKLLSSFEQDLSKQGIKKYKLSVNDYNKPAITFYEKHGFKHKKTFKLYGKKLSVYTKKNYQGVKHNDE